MDSARPSGVPWSTVLPLAVPMGLAASFWTVALRTSAGAIGRTTSPAESWLRETALLLPFFVLAVLGALTVARRHFGHDLARFRDVAPVSLLVAVCGAVAGIAELVVSSAYDYHLQVGELTTMSIMQDNCSQDCRNAVQHATLALQERSVLLGSVILLLTDLAVVAWVVALRGGRLRLLPPHAGRRSGTGPLDRLGLTRTLLVTGLVGSAVIHAAVVPEHLVEWTPAGGFFVLLIAVELTLAAGAFARGRRLRFALLPACLAVSVGPLLLWLVSRTLGLPFGPEAGVPEPVGIPDLAACALEIVTATATLVLLRSRDAAVPSRVAPSRVRYAAVLVLAVTTLGLGGTHVHWLSLGVDDPGPMGDATASVPSGQLRS